MQKLLLRLSRWLGLLALVCYILVAGAFLGVRYWVLPNINDWREPLQRGLSATLGEDIRLGHVSAQWHGRHPSIRVSHASLRDAAGRPIVNIPVLDAVVSWSSLLSGRPHFLGVRAEGVALTLRRGSDDALTIFGRSADEPADNQGSADAMGEQSGDHVLNWLTQLGTVQFTKARIRWIDESRKAPPLLFDDVALNVGMQGDAHVFSMQARPPEALGRSFRLQGSVRVDPQHPSQLSLDDVSGQFHVSVQDMRPAAWRPWLDVQSVLRRGEVDWQAWQVVDAGVLGHHVSEVAVRNGYWEQDGAQVSVASAQLYIAGPWSALKYTWLTNPAADAGPLPDVRFTARMHGLKVGVPDTLVAPLSFDDVAFATGARRDSNAGLSLDIDLLQLRNADMDLQLHGSWQELGGGVPGVADIQGEFRRAELAGIVHYLPAAVGQEAREWMRDGLVAGRLVNAPVRLSGDLAHFPFGDEPDKGDFYIGGRVRDVVIDYAPASQVGDPGWPRLEQLQGRAALHRVALSVHADTMRMRPGGLPIQLSDVDAHISNIESDSILQITGTGKAQADAYMALLQKSSLAQLLDNLFEEARAEGLWEVPISLTIPLLDTEQTKVSGAVEFHNAGLHLGKGYPPMSGIEGRASFTESTFSADGIKANVLGGPVAITGGLGKGLQGMAFEGRLNAKALTEFLGPSWRGLLEGSTAYRLSLQRTDSGGYGFGFDAPLEGMSFAFPPPLEKAAAERWPLRVRWTPESPKTPGRLDIQLREQLAAQLLRRKGSKGATFFQSGALNLQGTARPGPSGLKVDMQMPSVDIDAWRQLVNRFSAKEKSSQVAMLPPLRDLRVQADHARVFGIDLDRLTFTARQPEGQRWRVDVSSTQTAGTLFWQERQGRIQGDVDAHFERLALGNPAGEGAQGQSAEDEERFFDSDEEIDIPAIRLKIDRFRLYGRDVGAVSVVGVNESRGRNWRLKQLNVVSPHGSLKGEGVWRLAGPRRGLSLQATAAFNDMGAYLDQAGFKDIMREGNGEIRGNIEWLDVPWSFKRAALQGDLEVDLAKGRFNSVGSRSARLLELLSLQSVRRLATLEWNPAGLMRQGFPFDTLQGHFRIADGVMHSENYRVTGPVGTIVIAGDVDLPKEDLDLYAVVVPNLDVSGAAIAAGIALNPIVGLGAFLTQWLLKDPLGKAMAVEYRIRGSFDDPQMKAVSAPAQGVQEAEPH